MPPSYAIYPSLRDKVVIVTGGSEGIGAATVEHFCQQGSRVAILDISESGSQKLISKIQALVPWHPDFPISTPTFYRCDVTDLDQLRSAADRVAADLGPVEALVNNAAVAGANSRVPSAEVTEASWEFDVRVNLRHHFFLTQHVVPGMRARGRGSVVNMGSISWRIPATDMPVYVTCKSAVVGLTRTHAREFGRDGVRVNSVMPGAIATERQIEEVLTPEYRQEIFAAQALKRDLLPHEVAKVIVFLSSDEASAVTGSSYVVDGGWVGDP